MSLSEAERALDLQRAVQPERGREIHAFAEDPERPQVVVHVAQLHVVALAESGHDSARLATIAVQAKMGEVERDKAEQFRRSGCFGTPHKRKSTKHERSRLTCKQ